MKYDYSTKNFHRYQVTNADGTIREVYVPRDHMAQPVAAILLTPTIADATVVVEKSKPIKR